MVIYTQITRPVFDLDQTLWLPCLETETVKHIRAHKQPLVLTHIEPIKHYEHDISELLGERVYCIGGRTFSRLLQMGFINAWIFGPYAKDMIINSPCTWFHGDKYARDFSQMSGVTAIQTYRSSVNKESLEKILTMEDTSVSLYVYSSKVLETLEVKSYPTWTLYHTKSCKPNPELWLETKSFYPGEESNPSLNF